MLLVVTLFIFDFIFSFFHFLYRHFLSLGHSGLVLLLIAVVYTRRSFVYILFTMFAGLSFFTSLLALTAAAPSARNLPYSIAKNTTDDFPLTNPSNIIAHDPNVLFENGYYYMFKGGVHVPYSRASHMSGPWTDMGAVLSDDSIIHQGKANRTRPWAPTVIKRKGKFYCFYTLSGAGSQTSAIGVASTDDIENPPWTDHGALIRTGIGNGSDVFPFNQTNAIDASYIEDHETGKPYLNWGSFWKNIWQVPLEDDLLSIKNPENPDAVQLTYSPQPNAAKGGPEEGSWMSYRDGYYYTWFSDGICCEFEKGLPPLGNEYKIRVGRSENVRGPFYDHKNTSLLEGGGTVVYASNHGEIYAPGGLGTLSGDSKTPDILYYHYLNVTTGFGFKVSSPQMKREDKRRE